MPFAKLKCLIIDQMHLSIIPMLEEIGFAVSYQPEIKASEVKEILANYDGLIVRSKLRITDDLLADTQRLRFVARAGAGVDNVDEAALEKYHIKLLNAPEGNRDAVGEHTVGLLLALMRHVVKADREVRRYEWHREANRGEEIRGKTIGIVGYGNMGQSFAQRLSSFGCRVLAHDIDHTVVPDDYAMLCPLEQLKAEADVVSFHIPFTPANRYLADDSFLNSFRKNIWLLNSSRGEIVELKSLVQALKSGKVKGAALDVLENEKLATLSPEQKNSFEYLIKASNVILSPHIAGWTHESYVKINEVLTQKIKNLLPALK
ncbi:NAD(P)-dependent oxidoreductase [Adhaeribacter pallidiroseus]|uniref:Phosphoglycerate dehydrogenase n=1 Tax=Adhaeribacter pallidiroseus TaxID=2072847 RepID=A0A369QL73_9BACT|nr:NAD(P)-dependent oxidoreductase [Adhaeribacter pallidiroseus]RDC63018.1 Phosphoglycerate dehydrogenase [Adhaeribacter pallidiroseus]